MEVIIGIKPAPGDHESNFKKVGLIPFGLNTMGTILDTYPLSNKKKRKNVQGDYRFMYIDSYTTIHRPGVTRGLSL